MLCYPSERIFLFVVRGGRLKSGLQRNDEEAPRLFFFPRQNNGYSTKMIYLDMKIESILRKNTADCERLLFHRGILSEDFYRLVSQQGSFQSLEWKFKSASE